MSKLRTEIYADGANFRSILNLNKKNFIKGFTTNPTLMRKSGIKNYKIFCLKVLNSIKKKPISFEIFSDVFKEIKSQAYIISSWGKNVFGQLGNNLSNKVPSCVPIISSFSVIAIDAAKNGTVSVGASLSGSAPPP